jgi:uncharacterized protein YcnI
MYPRTERDLSTAREERQSERLDYHERLVRRGHQAGNRRQLLVAVVAALAAVAGLPGHAWAHIEVVPAESDAAATVRYGIRVPTEKPIPTVRVEVQFPADLRVLDFEAAAGWRLTAQTDGAGRPVDAVWDGGTIGPNEYAEFGLRAQNPYREAELRWTVIQTYQDGSEAQWSGPATGEFPAPTTRVRSRGVFSPETVGGVAVGVAIVALAISTLALATGHLRRGRRTSSHKLDL